MGLVVYELPVVAAIVLLEPVVSALPGHKRYEWRDFSDSTIPGAEAAP